MADSKRVRLAWEGEGLRFRGGPPDGPLLSLDGDGETGPSPRDGLLPSVAGCMAIDVRVIVEKSRVPLETLEVTAAGVRAEEPPRRFTRLTLAFRVSGPGEEDADAVERAVRLSRERYCSVLHSLRADLDVEIEISRKA